MNKQKFLCIHGHFYQPPRENSWIEEIELQESAAPYHDWNERICRECYGPNCYARILDEDKYIVDIISNYSLISFNFGPTLMSWLEKHAPETYAKILEADRVSIQRHGHGNAIAQAYNHMILPLANERDRETQILWGIEDFKHRFNRQPEAMWLPETAVNMQTLAALVQFGMKFIILSPTQARRIRPLEGGSWKDVLDGSIDSTRAYRCFLKGNNAKKVKDKFIDVFFYDSAISGELSFGDLLFDGNRFAERFNKAYNPENQQTQLIHIATDGETFGHHKKFGEMALAYALRQAEEKYGFTLTNYAAFLEQFPPEWEVELKKGPDGEGTAWSCAHGVGRWKDDCGCKVAWQGNWNQKWRKPLREAMDIHRDNLAELFIEKGAKYFHDLWAARNAYIKVILNRCTDNMDNFFVSYGREGIKKQDRIAALKLLEMQRYAMLMYTSCGWFFDDISGLEAIQILQYADRALQLAEEFTTKDIEGPFVERLSHATSNVQGYGTGRDIFFRFVRPSRINMERVLNHFVIASAFNRKGEKNDHIYHFRLTIHDYERKDSEKAFFAAGRVSMTSGITLEEKEFFFFLAFLGSYYFRSVVRQMMRGMDYSKVRGELFSKFNEAPDNIVNVMRDFFGEGIYSLRDMFQEEKQRILRQLIFKEMESYEDIYAKMFDNTRETIEAMIKEGLIIPVEFKVAAEHTLSRRMYREIELLRGDFSDMTHRESLRSILHEAEEFGYSLHKEPSCNLIREILKEMVKNLKTNFNESVLEQFHDFLSFVNDLPLEFDRMESQNIFYAILKERFDPLAEKANTGDEEARYFAVRLLDVAQKMGFQTMRFAHKIELVE